MTSAEIIQGTAYLARGYSKIVLTPQDIPGGVGDIVQGLTALGLQGMLKDIPVVVPPSMEEK